MKMKMSLLGLSLMTALLVVSPVSAQSTAPAEVPVVAPSSQVPARIPAENIDGSRANGRTQRDAARIIGEFTKAEQAGDTAASAKALADLNALHGRDPQNLTVVTWLGYVHLTSGRLDDAIAMLDKAVARPQMDAVNLANIRNLALAQYLKPNYPAAITHLNRLSAAMPEDGAVWALLGSSHVLSQNFSEAISPLRNAVRLLENDPQSRASATVDLAIALYRTDQKLEAARTLQGLDASQLTADQMSWIGFVYLQAGQLDPAITALEQAVAKDEGNLGAVNNLAGAYLQRNGNADRAKAKVLYARLAEASPDNATAQYNLGAMHLADGDFEAAKTHLERAVALRADSFALNNLGRAYEGLNQHAQAAANYGRASDMTPNDEVFARNAGFAYQRAGNPAQSTRYLKRALANGSTEPLVILNLADTLSRTGNDGEAHDLLVQNEAKFSSDADYWFNRGVVAMRLGKADDAEASYTKTLAIRPDDRDALNNVGLLQFNRGEFNAALATFQRLNRMNPDDQNVRLNLAACLARTNRLPGAIEIWREFVRKNPSRHDIRLNLADALWNTGDTGGARFHYAFVSREQPNNARALNGLGLWALLQNQNQEAERLFRAAVNADRKYIPGYFNLAVILERLDRAGEAVKVLEAAQRVDGNDEDVNNMLRRLRAQA